MIRKIVIAGGIFCFSFMSACAPVKQRPYRPPTYTYSPPDQTKLPNNIKIIYEPTYLSVNRYDRIPQIKDFNQAVSRNIKTILLTKGFSILQELSSREANPMQIQMAAIYAQQRAMGIPVSENAIGDKPTVDKILQQTPYPMKREAAAMVQSSLNLMISDQLRAQTNLASVLFGEKTYEGPIFISGEMEITYIEPLTYQVLLVQKFPITQKSAQVRIKLNDQSGMVKWSANGQSGAGIKETDALEKLDKMLEETFNEVLDQYWKFLSPEELKNMEGMIKELKQKKVYYEKVN